MELYKPLSERISVPVQFRRKFLLISYLGAQDEQLSAEQDQLPCGSTGTSSGNCQETETCMVWSMLHAMTASPLHKANDLVRNKINFLVGPQEHFLATVKRRKLARSTHNCVTRHDNLSNTILRHLGGWATPWLAEEMLACPCQNLLMTASCRKD